MKGIGWKCIFFRIYTVYSKITLCLICTYIYEHAKLIKLRLNHGWMIRIFHKLTHSYCPHDFPLTTGFLFIHSFFFFLLHQYSTRLMYDVTNWDLEKSWLETGYLLAIICWNCFKMDTLSTSMPRVGNSIHSYTVLHPSRYFAFLSNRVNTFPTVVEPD